MQRGALQFVLLLAFAATRPGWVRSTQKIAAAGADSPWKTEGTTQVATLSSACDPNYPQALLLAQGANATLTFSGAQIGIDGLRSPTGATMRFSIDNGPNLVFDTGSPTTTCQLFGSVNVDSAAQHVIRVSVPTGQADPQFFFALLGAQILTAAEETLITAPGPPPTSTQTHTSTDPTLGGISTTSSGSQSIKTPPTTSTTATSGSGLGTGPIVAIAIAVPSLLALLAVFVFWLLRRRRDRKTVDEHTGGGGPTPYTVRPNALPKAASPNDTNTSAFLSTVRDGKKRGTLNPYFAPDSTDPSSGSSPKTRAKASPSSPYDSQSASGSASASGSQPLSTSRGSSPAGAAQPEPAMQELYQAMNQAGFTVNTLFDRLRRDAVTEAPMEERRREPRASAAPPTEILPRYE